MPQEGCSFVVDIALNMTGLDAQQKTTIEAALPDILALINQVMPHLQKVAPALQIVADSISKDNTKISLSAAHHAVPSNIRLTAAISPTAYSGRE